MPGDHPALDILNTVARVEGELVDSLRTDREVLEDALQRSHEQRLIRV